MNPLTADPACPAPTGPKVTVVIVSFNTREITLEAIRSVMSQPASACYQVVVVDNASADGSADAIEKEFGSRLELIRSETNLGFGPANNLGAQQAASRWLLLLNPDTVVFDGAIDRLIECAERSPSHGIFGGITRFPDGSPNPTSAWSAPTLWSMLCRGGGLSAIFPNSPLFNPETMPAWDRVTSRHVDIVSGCYLMIERGLWADLGGFDPGFLLYAEEFDLCLRAARLGAKPYVCAESVIVHIGGASDRVREDQTVRQFAARAMLFCKHWPAWRARMGIGCLTLWAFNKRLRARIRRRKDETLTWTRIWNRRNEWRSPDAANHLKATPPS